MDSVQNQEINYKEIYVESVALSEKIGLLLESETPVPANKVLKLIELRKALMAYHE